MGAATDNTKNKNVFQGAKAVLFWTSKPFETKAPILSLENKSKMAPSESAFCKKGSLDKSQEDDGQASKVGEDQKKNAKPGRQEEKEEQPANPSGSRMRKATRRIG